MEVFIKHDLMYNNRVQYIIVEKDRQSEPVSSANNASSLLNHCCNVEKSPVLPFPRVFHCGCNRSFQYKRLEKYVCLVYSKAVDGGFCWFCALLARHSKLTVLVNKPFVTFSQGTQGHP